MKSKIIISSIVVMSLAASSLAFAQGYGGGRNDRDMGRGGPGGPGGDRGQQYDKHNGKHDGRHDNRPGNRHDGRHDNRRDGRGAGPNHNFYKGDRLSGEYRNRQYVVNDWRSHRLNPPPRGYHWVQTGGDYVLVAIATGIIAQILLSN